MILAISDCLNSDTPVHFFQKAERLIPSLCVISSTEIP